MSRDEQRRAMRRVREDLIARLETLYRESFDRIGQEALGEGAVARLTQLLLRSREAAIAPLQQEIEAPLITHAPSQPGGADVAGEAVEGAGDGR
jgi:hercynine metabolism small protein